MAPTTTLAENRQRLAEITDSVAPSPLTTRSESRRFWQASPGPHHPITCRETDPGAKANQTASRDDFVFGLLTRTEAACPLCAGMGWVQDSTGRAVKCRMCADFLASSRLSATEQENRLDSVANLSPIHPVAVHMAQGLLVDRGGWLTLWGNYGSGKSLILTGLVADACRAGRMGHYYSGLDILATFQRDMRDGDSDPGRGTNLDFLARIPILALDELAGFHTSSDWFARHFVELLDRRYRNADRLITVLALNPDPVDWCNGPGGVWSVSGPAILSRMRDGRFCRDWPAGMARPAGMERERIIPGILRFDAPDVRPNLRREAAN